MSLPDKSDRQAYKPGQTVPATGIYAVVHDLHRPEHEVVAIRGEEFPPCRICRDEVRFYVANQVPHMMHDFDLAGPGNRALKRRARAANKGTE